MKSATFVIFTRLPGGKGADRHLLRRNFILKDL